MVRHLIMGARALVVTVMAGQEVTTDQAQVTTLVADQAQMAGQMVDLPRGMDPARRAAALLPLPSIVPDKW